MDEVVRNIDVKEFRRLGFLQEANRKFFHPLGLALEVVINGDGTETLGGIWDYRDDPEGNLFGADMIKQEAIDYVEKLRKSKVKIRKEKQKELGVKIDHNGIQII